MIKIKLKQTNKGYKCSSCKQYTLDELPNDLRNTHERQVITGVEGWCNPKKPRKFKCRACLAEFEEVRKIG